MLLVKSICDWADSSKNDDWQEYAADVAAAYTIAIVHEAPFEFNLENLKPQVKRLKEKNIRIKVK
ncbi:MAG: hypothetical protein GQ542_15950 [Desulforhopalus sp.]|nr:hypothetical protein [Desulforhopalus sp.]